MDTQSKHKASRPPIHTRQTEARHSRCAGSACPFKKALRYFKKARSCASKTTVCVFVQWRENADRHLRVVQNVPFPI